MARDGFEQCIVGNESKKFRTISQTVSKFRIIAVSRPVASFRGRGSSSVRPWATIDENLVSGSPVVIAEVNDPVRTSCTEKVSGAVISEEVFRSPRQDCIQRRFEPGAQAAVNEFNKHIVPSQDTPDHTHLDVDVVFFYRPSFPRQALWIE